MRRVPLIVLLFALATGLAFAQSLTSGTLEGLVVDEGGSPIADAVITAMGPQGVRTTVTDSQGRFTIRGLAPGKYSVKAEASGYGTIVQSDVELFIGRRTQLPFTLTEGVTEEVTVTSEAPLVDMKSTTTGESIRIDDFAPYVPLGRNIVSVFTIAPGVSDGGALGDTNSSISGSSGLENAYFVDGVNITNSGYGGLGAYSIEYGSLGTGVTYDFLEEVQVKTGGFEAEFGQAGGGIVNTVVKTGTNDFSFDAAWYEEPTSLEGNYGLRVDSPNWANRISSLRRDITLSAGGPIMKDKLFYFAAYNPITIEQDYTLTSGDGEIGYDLDFDPATPDQFFAVGQSITGGRTPAEVTRERTIDNYAGKLSWFVTPNHKLEVTAFGDPSDGEVGPQSPVTFLRNFTNPEISDISAGATGLDWGGDQLALKYQGVWTSNFFTELQFSTKENNFDETGPGTLARAFFDSDADNTFGGAGFFTTSADETDQLTFKNTHVFGPVEVSYGYQWEDITYTQGRNYSGDPYTTIFPNLIEDGAGNTGFAPGCTTFSINDPACYTSFSSSTGASVTILNSGGPGAPIYDVIRTDYIPPGDPTTAEETNYFAQVGWDVIPTVTVRAGLRLTEQDLQGSGNVTLPICTLSDGTTAGGCSTTLTGQAYEFDSEVAPRVGVSWDVRGDGKHKLFANWGEYFQRVPSDLAVRAFSNEVGVTTEQFNDALLTDPLLNTTCGIDTNADGLFDATVPCHLSEDVQGLAGGGSIILDGTQRTPGSDVFEELHGLHTLTTSAKTALPSTKEWLAGWAWEVNDYTGVEVRYIHRELGTVLEDIQFASSESTQNLFAFLNAGGETDWGLGFSELGRNCDPNTPFADCLPFPGHGVGAFGAYVFANPGDNVNTTLFPTPKRDYDALEFIYKRRFHNGWMAYANYRWAKLRGNYEGSFRNDNGQSDPFLTSLFDFPAATAVDSDPATDANGDGTPDNDFDVFLNSDTMAGHYIDSGPLNTERRHIFNGFLSKQFDFGLNVGTRVNVRTGQPRLALFAHPSYRNSGEVPGFNPVYYLGVTVDVDGDAVADGTGIFTTSNPGPGGSNAIGDASVDFDGDGTNDTIVGIFRSQRLWSYDVVERGFFGRTPTLVTFDLSFSYDIDLRGGQSKLSLLLDVFNLFNDNAAIGFDQDIETLPGVSNNNYLKPNQFQTPRNVRLGVKYTF